MKQYFVEINSNCSEETEALARDIARNLQPGMAVAFYGDLGTGKTTMIKQICFELAVSDTVTSPSFAIVQEYSGKHPIYHFDFYRLDTLEEIMDIGFETYLESGGICLIEWPEKAEVMLPATCVKISLQTIFSRDEIEPTRRIINIASPFNFQPGELNR